MSEVSQQSVGREGDIIKPNGGLNLVAYDRRGA